MTLRGLLVLAVLSLTTIMAQPAYADCWRLPNGQVVQTQSQSTPPVSRAVRVACPQVSLPTPRVQEQRGVTQFDQRPDDRECVAYVRSRVRLPSVDLTSWTAKQSLINQSEPRAGFVAIINEAQPYGHLALVEEVTGNAITISETNYRHGYFQRRRAVGSDLADAARQLRIVGYMRP